MKMSFSDKLAYLIAAMAPWLMVCIMDPGFKTWQETIHYVAICWMIASPVFFLIGIWLAHTEAVRKTKSLNGLD